MAVEVRVPQAGESVTEAMIAKWLKAEGDFVQQDEPLVLLETDKASVEVPAPVSGLLVRIERGQGEVVKVGELLALIDENAKPQLAKKPTAEKPHSDVEKQIARPPDERGPAPEEKKQEPRIMPAAQRLMAETGVDLEAVTPTGPGGRLLKEDVERALEKTKETQAQPEVAAARDREEEVVPMSMLRRRIAEKLVAARLEMALLTTFNEIDMSRVQAIRRERGEAFQARHGIKLGIMSFFVKAVIDALKRFPIVNASVRGHDIVYHNYYDIGIAVSTDRGLVVPILRDADRLSFAEVEKAIADFAKRARENRLDVAELQGGTFTITNGGIFGSLMSTPIVNPPQSAVLGLHAIQERPVVRDGQIVVRPMMYVALSYDHRIIDGREAVSFLRHVKEVVEDPALLLLEL